MITTIIAEQFLRDLPAVLRFQGGGLVLLLWGAGLCGALAVIRYFGQEKIKRWIFLGLALSAVFCEVLLSLLFRYYWRVALGIYSGVALVEYCLLSALVGACAVWIFRFFKNRVS